MDPLIDDPAARVAGLTGAGLLLYRIWLWLKSEKRTDDGAGVQAGAYAATIEMLQKTVQRQVEDTANLRTLLEAESSRRRAAESRIAILEMQVIKLGGTI